MEYREIYTPAPLIVAGVTIEVDVSLSVSLWHLEPSIGGKGAARRVSAGSASAEPVTIRITTGGKTVCLPLSESTAGETDPIGETHSIIEADQKR